MGWKKWFENAQFIRDFPLFQFGDNTVRVGTLLAATAILLTTILIARLVTKGFDQALQRSDIKDPGTIRVFDRLIHYTILLIGFGIALETIGLDLTALFTAGAVFAIGLGFAMQNIAQNFVSGIILLLERSIKPGDVLDVEGRIVKVSRMGIRSTVARTLDEEDIIIPNSALVQAPVKNYTLKDSLYRIRTTVGVVYSADMAKVQRVLAETARAMTWRVQSKEPRIFMLEFGDSSVNFEIGIWTEDPWKSRIRKSELNDAVWWALKKANITIAFPQLDLHFDPPLTDALIGNSKTMADSP